MTLNDMIDNLIGIREKHPELCDKPITIDSAYRESGGKEDGRVQTLILDMKLLGIAFEGGENNRTVILVSSLPEIMRNLIETAREGVKGGGIDEHTKHI